MFIEVNNPGNGDCAFYAFVIALIDVIKHEHNKLGSSPTFDKWCLLSKEVDHKRDTILPQILAFDFSRLGRDKKLGSTADKPSRELLKILQASTRRIVFREKCSELQLAGQKAMKKLKDDTGHISFESKNEILGNGIYLKFSEIFYSLYKNGHIDDVAVDNDLVKSRTIMSWIKDLIKKVRTKNFHKPTDEMTQTSLQLPESERPGFIEKQLFSRKNKYLDEQVFHAFAEDVFGKNYRTTRFSELHHLTSYILHYLKQITRNRKICGTHNDLNSLSHLFEVNLHILEDGQSRFTPIDQPGKPVITLDNLRSQHHWVTRIETSKSMVKNSTKQFQTFATDSLLTKKEILQIFASYKSSLFDDHTAQVNNIIAECRDPVKTVNDVITLIVNYGGICKENGSYGERVRYVRERYDHYNGVDDNNTIYTQLSRKEIGNVLQNYLNEGSSASKNHKDIANEIINDCNSKKPRKIPVATIMHKIEHYLTSGSTRFKPDSTFKTAADYLLANYRKEEGRPPQLSKGYIRTLFQSYVNHSGSYFSKHHRIKALRTIEMCDDPGRTVNDIAQSLTNYKPLRFFGDRSTFKKLSNYVIGTNRSNNQVVTPVVPKVTEQDDNQENNSDTKFVI